MIVDFQNKSWEVEYRRNGIILTMDIPMYMNYNLEADMQELSDFVRDQGIGKRISITKIWLDKSEYLDLLLLVKG
jgi:hypothetical protein